MRKSRVVGVAAGFGLLALFLFIWLRGPAHLEREYAPD
jgi:hypothetical protein